MSDPPIAIPPERPADLPRPPVPYGTPVHQPPTTPAQPWGPGPQQPETAAVETRRRKWVIPVVSAVAGLVVGIAAGGAGSDDPAAAPAPTTTVIETVRAPAEPAETITVDPSDDLQAELDALSAELDTRQAALDQRQAELDARAEAISGQEAAVEAGTFPGDGTFLVGTDIQPGTYRGNAGSSDLCYWARLSGLSGELGDIISNETASGPTVVTIGASDVASDTNGCGEWTLVP